MRRIQLLAYFILGFSFLGNAQFDRNQSKKKVDLSPIGKKGKINQIDLSKDCGDLSVKEIKYELVSKKTERVGTVKITGVVENTSSNRFKTEKGKSRIKLVETTKKGNRIVKGVRLKELSNGKEVVLEFVRRWYAGSSSILRPTSYSVEIDHPKSKTIPPIHNDCIPLNNKGKRETADIETLFQKKN